MRNCAGRHRRIACFPRDDNGRLPLRPVLVVAVALDLDFVAGVQRRGIAGRLPGDGHLIALHLGGNILGWFWWFLKGLNRRRVGPGTMAAAVVGADANVVLGAKVEVLHTSHQIRPLVHNQILHTCLVGRVQVAGRACGSSERELKIGYWPSVVVWMPPADLESVTDTRGCRCRFLWLTGWSWLCLYL